MHLMASYTKATMELAMKVQRVIFASHGQEVHLVASSGDLSASATVTCNADESATRKLAFAGRLIGGAASLP
jgi:hypothetical protein